MICGFRPTQEIHILSSLQNPWSLVYKLHLEPADAVPNLVDHEHDKLILNGNQ